MKTKLSIAVGVKIRKLRQAGGISQEAFADLINFDRSNYGAIERGERNISLRTIARIAIGLKCEMYELFPSIAEIKRLLG